MPTGPIVVALTLFKRGSSGMRPRLKSLAINTSALEAMKKALHGGIVVTIACMAHAHLNAFLLQGRLIALTGVGTSTNFHDAVNQPVEADEPVPSVELVPPASHLGLLLCSILPPCEKTDQAQLLDLTIPSSVQM